MGSSQAMFIDVVSQRYDLVAWVTGLALLVVMLAVFCGNRDESEEAMLTASPDEVEGGRYGAPDNPRIPPEEMYRPRRPQRLPLPPLREQLLRCLALTGEMFATVMEGSQYERGALLVLHCTNWN